jgi:hypothetical protein
LPIQQPNASQDSLASTWFRLATTAFALVRVSWVSPSFLKGAAEPGSTPNRLAKSQAVSLFADQASNPLKYAGSNVDK